MPYQNFTVARTTIPDPIALMAQLRAFDSTIGTNPPYKGKVSVKKNSNWTAPQITTVQNILETAPELTPQRAAQNEIDSWPIATRALVLAMVDQINVLRAGMNPALPPITPAQAFAAIRTKAGTL